MLRTLILLVALASMLRCTSDDIQEYPDIILILADDLGYGDPMCYNADSKIPTPSIDRLALEGVRYTDAHTPSSVCTPTRYGVLTGRYAWRTALKKSVLWSWDRPLIAEERLTLPAMLKPMGYQTACIGKWHLGWRWPGKGADTYVNDSLKIGDYDFVGRDDLHKEIDFNKTLDGGPVDRGFDYYFGDDVPNFPPYAFIENNRLVAVPTVQKPDSMFGRPGPMIDGWDLAKVIPTITEKAIAFIRQARQDRAPFFLYLPLNAPHTPIAPAERFRNQSEAGAYGDFVCQVDDIVRQVYEAVHEAESGRETLIIFTSDNGSPQRDGTNMSGKIGSIKNFGHDPSKPWRGLKADIWEGGHRVPLIIHWPGQIAPNGVNTDPFCLTDIMPSIAGILNIDLPKGAAEDGLDLSRQWIHSDEKSAQRTHLIHHAIDGTFAVRKGPWKLIAGQDSGGFSKNLPEENVSVSTPGQLYNLDRDPRERNNLYTRQPTIVKELDELLKQVTILK